MLPSVRVTRCTTSGRESGECAMPSKEELKMLQALPLEIKVAKTKQRICEFVERFGEDGVYVSFSGGKDSTVLLHIVRSMYPNIEAVFVDTGLEYPEIRQFVKTFDNVTILRPNMRFDEVISKYGYPIISKEISKYIKEARSAILKGKNDYYALQKLQGTLKDKQGNKSIYNCEKYGKLIGTKFLISNQCCDVMKKRPVKKYSKQYNKYPILATITDESRLREEKFLRFGCNAFEEKTPSSQPMSFWKENDILQYIKQNNIAIASVYGDVVYEDDSGYNYECSLLGYGKLKTTEAKRTGCIFCAFGCHLEKGESRFQRLKRTHPRQYEYCIGGGEYDADGIWKPNKEGLGMGHVFDELNKIYGEGFIKYK